MEIHLNNRVRLGPHGSSLFNERIKKGPATGAAAKFESREKAASLFRMNAEHL